MKKEILEKLAKEKKDFTRTTSGNGAIQIASALSEIMLKDGERENISWRRWKAGRSLVKLEGKTQNFNWSYEAIDKKLRVYFGSETEQMDMAAKREQSVLQAKLDKLVPASMAKILGEVDRSEFTMEQHKVMVKIFNPTGGQTWYIYDKDNNDPNDDIYWAFVNLGDIDCAECGTISLQEIASLKGMFQLPMERDRHFDPMPLNEVIDKVKAGKHV